MNLQIDIMVSRLCVLGMFLCGCGLFFGGRARERRLRAVISEQNSCLHSYAGCIIDLLDELERRLVLTDEEKTGIDDIRKEVSKQFDVLSQFGD